MESAEDVSYAVGGELAQSLDDLTRSGNDILNIIISDEGENVA